MNISMAKPLKASAKSLQDPFMKAVADLINHLDVINRFYYDSVAEEEIREVKRLWPKD